MSKKHSVKLDIGLLISILILISQLFEFYVIPYLEKSNSPAPQDNSQLQIHFIDVGQADSTLIMLDGFSMLIDAGNNADGNLVVDYLKGHNVSKLDYLIGTHPHEDHIGGLDTVINNFDVDTFIMPKVSNNTKTFEDVLDAAADKNLSITTPNIGDSYNLSDAKFTILSCKNENTKELNTTSIVIRLVFGNESFLFCADAEKENEYSMLESNLELQSNVIKIAHHGSSTSSSEKFLLAVNPEVAIISVGANNDFGHPHEKVVNRLSRLGIKIYRTDLNGNIVISSDGNSFTVDVQKEEAL